MPATPLYSTETPNAVAQDKSVGFSHWTFILCLSSTHSASAFFVCGFCLINLYTRLLFTMKPWNFIPSAWPFTLPTNIQKRLQKYMLRKAIGQFLANDLDLEDFDIELVNGSVELRELNLNLEASKKISSAA